MIGLFKTYFDEETKIGGGVAVTDIKKGTLVSPQGICSKQSVECGPGGSLEFTLNNRSEATKANKATLNHSCRPNVHVCYHGEYRAMAKIKAGEEITINYFGSDSLMGMLFKKWRRDIFLSELPFDCKCELCEKETVDDQEALQKEMAEIQSEMPAWTKECLEFNESKDFVLDHRQKYNTKMAELEREIATTREEQRKFELKCCGSGNLGLRPAEEINKIKQDHRIKLKKLKDEVEKLKASKEEFSKQNWPKIEKDWNRRNLAIYQAKSIDHVKTTTTRAWLPTKVQGIGFNFSPELEKEFNDSYIFELISEHETLKEDQIIALKTTDLSTRHQNYSYEKSKKHIEVIKKLFSLGKEKKSQPICLYYLVFHGYNAAYLGHSVTEHRGWRRELQKEGVNFAKTAEKFEKFLGSEIVNPEKWRRRQQNVFSSE